MQKDSSLLFSGGVSILSSHDDAAYRPMLNPRPTVHPTRALIDLHAFRHNIAVVRSRIDVRTRIMAVVKANAYGHGMTTIAKAAVAEGVEYLGVARIDEALQLRSAGILSPILVFELIAQDRFAQAIEENIDITVSSIEGARALNGIAGRLLRKAKVHIKVDTGMGRLGLDPVLAPVEIETIETFRWIEIVGIYSHFATSEETDQAFARQQLSTFTGIVESLQRRFPLVHMANSGAILTLPEAQCTMVRPGMMLYGYPPLRGLDRSLPLQPVMSLESEVTLVKRVRKGTPISYGRRYEAPAETRIATVPIGYGDGYPRALTGKAEVLIRGIRYRVAGTICMDHLMVDVGRSTDVHEGDLVTLIGSQGNERITAWDIADQISTIPYEVTTGILSRVPRVSVSHDPASG
jgi:alanine racemase